MHNDRVARLSPASIASDAEKLNHTRADSRPLATALQILGCAVINTPDVSRRQIRTCITPAFVLRVLESNLHFFNIYNSTARPDYLQFCFSCFQCAFNVRRADLGPQQKTSRHYRCCYRPVPGCLVVASQAELLRGEHLLCNPGHVRPATPLRSS